MAVDAEAACSGLTASSLRSTAVAHGGGISSRHPLSADDRTGIPARVEAEVRTLLEYKRGKHDDGEMRSWRGDGLASLTEATRAPSSAFASINGGHEPLPDLTCGAETWG